VDAIYNQTRNLDLLQKKVNVLLGFAVALLGICGYLFYRLLLI
jgi:hypothetical protein